jgi:hypothetical protein
MTRRLLGALALTFGCVLGLGAVPLSAAFAAPPDVETFSDPFSGEFSCPGFDAVFAGHDRGRITNFFDRNGELVRQVGHIHATETDTNLSTGVSVRVDTNITVHADLLPDGSFGTFSITGQFNVATRPGKGIVLHDTGRVEFDAEGNPVVFRGVHDTFTKGEQAFCDALS